MSSEEKDRELTAAQESLQKSFNYLAMNLEIADPASEFAVIDVMKDELGMRHFRLQQVYEGLRVFGRHLIVHVTKDGDVRDATGDYRKGVVGMNIEPRLSAADALETARKDFGTEPSEKFTTELLIYPESGGTKNYLAHLVTMPLWQDGIPMRQRYFIDANTGEILERYNDQSVTGEASSAGGIGERLLKK